MVKMKVKDTKTGKVSTITKTAYDLLAKAGKHKHLDVLEGNVTLEVAAPTSTDTGGGSGEGGEGSKTSIDFKAEDAINHIKALETVEAIELFVTEDEERKTVIAASADRKAELS